jgi:hypothetical protein
MGVAVRELGWGTLVHSRGISGRIGSLLDFRECSDCVGFLGGMVLILREWDWLRALYARGSVLEF